VPDVPPEGAGQGGVHAVVAGEEEGVMARPLRQVPQARQLEVLQVSVSEGAGTEEEPVRHVVYYLTLEGKFLARHDEVEDAWVRPIEKMLSRTYADPQA